MRDWSSAFWPASYKGVPFRVEKEDLDGGRRIATHEFPYRDDPLHQDLGSAAARWEVTAYLASEAADTEAAALVAVLDTEGPGPLVLPIDGPVLARAHKWRRSREKDKAGYIAWSLTFLREGASSSSVTVSSLAQAVFDVVDGLGAVLDLVSGGFAMIGLGLDLVSGGLASLGFGVISAAFDLVDWVADAVVSGLVDIAAGIDIVVATVIDDVDSSYLLGGALSAAVAAIEGGTDFASSAAIASTFAALGLDVPATGASAASVLLTLARTVADLAISADPVSGPARVIEAHADWIAADPPDVPVTVATPSRLAAGRNAVRLDALARLIGLAVTAEALVRTTWSCRQDGVAARALFAAGADRAAYGLSSLGAAEAAEPMAALHDLRGATVEWLTRAIADLAPVRTVTFAVELPATVAAWVLYGDPTRGAELAARNRLSHPQYLPRSFEALAS